MDKRKPNTLASASWTTAFESFEWNGDGEEKRAHVLVQQAHGLPTHTIALKAAGFPPLGAVVGFYLDMLWFICVSLSVFSLMFRVWLGGGVVKYSQHTMHTRGSWWRGGLAADFTKPKADSTCRGVLCYSGPCTLYSEWPVVQEIPTPHCSCPRGGFWLTLLGSERICYWAVTVHG